MPVKVLLFNSIDRALQQQKMHANDFEYLGVKFTTPEFFLQDLFDISGVNRKLIDDAERLGILLGIYSSSDSEFENICSSGVIAFLTEFIENVGDWDAYIKRKDEILGGRIEVSGLERDVYKLSDEYFKYLEHAGEFIEASQFARGYAELFKGKYDIKLIDKIDLQSYEYELFSKISVSEIKFDSLEIEDAYKDIDLDLNVMTGVRAQYKAISDEMTKIKDGEKVLFVVNDTLEAYEQVLAIANNKGMEACITASANVCIRDTFIGRALYEYSDITSKDNDIDNVADFSLSPYLGLDEPVCVDIDSKLRNAELKNSDEALALICMHAESSLNNLLNFFDINCQDKDLSNKLLSQLDKYSGCVSINKQIEARAISAIRAIFDNYSRVCNVWDEGLVNSILDPSITASFSNVSDKSEANKNITEIVIESALNVVNLKLGVFDRVVCFDTSELSYSIVEPRRSIDTTFEALNLHKMISEYDKTRHAFTMLPQMLKDSNSQLTLYFLLRDAEEKEISVSFPMQELISGHYPSFDFEKITTSLSNCGINYQIYGEDDLLEAFGNVNKTSLGESVEYEIDETGTYLFGKILDFIPTKEINGEIYPILSPSQIEKYMQCPYKWFIEYCISPYRVDKIFDNAFIGTFIHDTFKLVYDRAKKDGIDRFYKGDDELIEKYVTDAMQDNIQEYLENIDGHLDWLYKFPRMNGQDLSKLVRLTGGMISCIKQLSKFSDTMIVSEHESELSLDLNTTFGGAIIKGRIDRVDIDKTNNTFCVVDYKSNTKSGYCLNDCLIKCDDDFIIPKHSQVYIYASCIAQTFANEGLDVKPSAAVYASYKSKSIDSDRVCGIVTDTFATTETYPATDRKNISDFEKYLNDLSDHVGTYIKELCRGNITPRPLDNACDYCMAQFCPARKVSR